MLCDNCKNNKAIISYTKMIGNQIDEVHLCAECAEKKMREDMVFNNVVTEKVESFLRELFKLTGKNNNFVGDKKCGNCGSTFKELEQNRLGCEECYEEFKEEIESMLQSLKFSSKHMGKIPKGAGEAPVYKREEEELMSKLKNAVDVENYEEAAVLRDKLKELREANECNTVQ
ncbi:MAG: UvrB/UvrC motif-containing protein [Peptoniphilus sp.]|nr:UvrB/UvrC motif-containing protein [Peptoniphilus sp.]